MEDRLRARKVYGLPGMLALFLGLAAFLPAIAHDGDSEINASANACP
jgi:hypothetical protein